MVLQARSKVCPYISYHHSLCLSFSVFFCFVLLCFLLAAWIIYYAKCIVENIIFSPIIHLNLESNACITEINVDLIINNTKIKDNQLRTVQCLDVFREHKPRNWRDRIFSSWGPWDLALFLLCASSCTFLWVITHLLLKKKGWSFFLSHRLFTHHSYFEMFMTTSLIWLRKDHVSNCLTTAFLTWSFLWISPKFEQK